jgi:hypothetical protein
MKRHDADAQGLRYLALIPSLPRKRPGFVKFARDFGSRVPLFFSWHVVPPEPKYGRGQSTALGNPAAAATYNWPHSCDEPHTLGLLLCPTNTQARQL